MHPPKTRVWTVGTCWAAAAALVVLLPGQPSSPAPRFEDAAARRVVELPSTAPRVAVSSRPAVSRPSVTATEEPAIAVARPSVPDPGTVVVPGIIDATGQRDVTDELNAWLAAVPDGGVAALLPHGRYRVEGTLQLVGRSGVTILGNGATIFATTPGDRKRGQIRLIGGSSLRITDLVITGAHPAGGTQESAYVASKEAQHGIEALAVRGLTVDHVTISDVYGDFVYLGPRQGVPTSDVRVTDNEFRRNGRQGVSLTGATRVLIENNVISETRRATFDFEANFARDSITDVTLRANRIGAGRLLFIAAAGKGEVSNVVVDHNDLFGRAMNSVITSRGPVRNHDWTFTGNTSSKGFGNPLGGVLRFGAVNQISVTGNVQPVQRKRNMSLVRVDQSCGVVVSGNDVANGGQSTTRSPCPTAS